MFGELEASEYCKGNMGFLISKEERIWRASSRMKLWKNFSGASDEGLLVENGFFSKSKLFAREV